MSENKIFVIESGDYSGFATIEGVYDNLETAQIEIQKLVREINNIIPALRFHRQELFKEETITDDPYNVIIRFGNNIRTIEIIELQINKTYNKIISWYN